MQCSWRSLPAVLSLRFTPFRFPTAYPLPSYCKCEAASCPGADWQEHVPRYASFQALTSRHLRTGTAGSGLLDHRVRRCLLTSRGRMGSPKASRDYKKEPSPGMIPAKDARRRIVALPLFLFCLLIHSCRITFLHDSAVAENRKCNGKQEHAGGSRCLNKISVRPFVAN